MGHDRDQQLTNGAPAMSEPGNADSGRHAVASAGPPVSARAPFAGGAGAGDGMVHSHYVPLDWRDGLVVLVINLIWGLNLIAIKMATRVMGALTAATLRQIIVFAVCAAALRMVPGRTRTLVLLGLMTGGIYFAIVNMAVHLADNVAALAIASQLGAPFGVLAGVLFLHERVTPIQIGGIALSFIGVSLLVFHPAGHGDLIAMGLTVISSAIWAGSSLIQRRIAGVPVMTIYAYMGLFGTMVLAPLALALEPDAIRALPGMPLRDFGWVAFSAIGSTLIGQGSMSWLLRRHPVSIIAPLTLMSPVVSVISSAWYFGTPITVLMMIGGCIAMGGVALVTWRRRQQATRDEGDARA